MAPLVGRDALECRRPAGVLLDRAARRRAGSRRARAGSRGSGRSPGTSGPSYPALDSARCRATRGPGCDISRRVTCRRDAAARRAAALASGRWSRSCPTPSCRRRSPFTRGPRARSGTCDAGPLQGADPDGADDLVGIKWIAGFPGTGLAGLPTLHGSSCSSTRSTAGRWRSSTRGRSPRSGRRPCPAWRSPGSPPIVDRRRAALIGAGVQGRSHLPVLGGVLPGVHLSVFDRHPDRAAAPPMRPGRRRASRGEPPPPPARPSRAPTSSSPQRRSARSAR